MIEDRNDLEATSNRIVAPDDPYQRLFRVWPPRWGDERVSTSGESAETPLLHDEVLDPQRRAGVEVRHVEDEDGLHAFRARVPAVFVDIPDRLPALIE